MYRHTQTGWLLLCALGVGALCFGGIALVVARQASPWETPLPYFCLLFGALTLLFSALTVTVDSYGVEVRFGPGLIRKRVPLSEIQACRPVRSQWWYGWGLRLVPGGWLWNVSGLDAVELLVANERIFRIGTDEPERLSAAINQQIASAR